MTSGVAVEVFWSIHRYDTSPARSETNKVGFACMSDMKFARFETNCCSLPVPSIPSNVKSAAGGTEITVIAFA
jgi:hypothetical protein